MGKVYIQPWECLRCSNTGTMEIERNEPEARVTRRIIASHGRFYPECQTPKIKIGTVKRQEGPR